MCIVRTVKVNRKAEAKKIFVNYIAVKRAQNKKTAINQRWAKVKPLPNIIL